MTSSVDVDASAGAEIAAETSVGRALMGLVPAGARLHVPEHFYAECGAVLRKWANGNVLPEPRLALAADRLVRLPLRRAQVRELVPAAWRLRGYGTTSRLPTRSTSPWRNGCRPRS